MTLNNTVDTLHLISDRASAIGFFLNFIFGVIGNSINIIIFRTKLKGNTCPLYLFYAELCNTILLLILLLPNAITRIRGESIFKSNMIWCKAGRYLFQICTTTSILMLCLAAIDRFHSTCRSASRRQWSSMKNTKISIIISIAISCCFHIPELFYSVTDFIICGYESEGYKIYLAYVLNPILLTFLPFIILFVFNWLTYRNLKTLQASRSESRTQRHLFKLLFLQSLCFFIATVGNSIFDLYYFATEVYKKDAIRLAIERLFSTAASIIYWTYPSSSFYVYYFSSKSFRSHVNKLFKCKRAVAININEHK